MQKQFSLSLAENYTSPSQKIRVMTESWFLSGKCKEKKFYLRNIISKVLKWNGWR